MEWLAKVALIAFSTFAQGDKTLKEVKGKEQ